MDTINLTDGGVVLEATNQLRWRMSEPGAELGTCNKPFQGTSVLEQLWIDRSTGASNWRPVPYEIP